jgi:hypothetical protein
MLQRFAVGAVYDRATFASGWAKCAVIDRAYSGEWLANCGSFGFWVYIFSAALDADSGVAPDFVRSFDAEAKLCDLLINGHDIAVMGT